MKKYLSCIAAILLVLALAAGCAQPGAGTAPADEAAPAPAATEAAPAPAETAEAAGTTVQTAPVRFFCRTNADRESMPENNLVLEYIYQLTGIELEIIAVPQEALVERVDLMIAANEAFDGLNLVGFAPNHVELMTRGALMPLNDLLDQYGPNVRRVMEPGFYTSTDTEGNIWALPRSERFPQGFVPSIREDWLEALGMSMPSTLAELEAFFEAVQTYDLTGSGTAEDQIPYLPNGLLYGMSNFIPFFLDVEAGYLTTGGWPEPPRTGRFMDAEGNIRPSVTHPNMIYLIELFRDWYERGFMPADIHLLRGAQLGDIRTTGTVGFLGGWFADGYAPMNSWNEANPDRPPGRYIPLPPLRNALGHSMWPSNPPVAPQIVFMRNAQNPEALMRYFDWITSDSQNTATVQFGIEGSHWNWVPHQPNTIELTPHGTVSYREFFALANLWWTGLMPEIYVNPEATLEYWRSSDMQTIRGFGPAAAPFDAHIPYDFIGTDAEFLTADGATLIEESVIRIVIGEMPLEEWPSIIELYNSIEGDILSAIWTQQYWDFVGGR